MAAASLALLLVADGSAVAVELNPVEIKVLTLLKIIEGTEWPEGTFFNPDEPLVIGVVGEDPYGSVLDEYGTRRAYQGHAIEVRRFASIDAVMPCHVLVVGALEGETVDRALDLVSGLGTLTFGETPDFLSHGGMVRIRIAKRRMKYEVNQGAAGREGLSFSEKVLTVATRVDG